MNYLVLIVIFVSSFAAAEYTDSQLTYETMSRVNQVCIDHISQYVAPDSYGREFRYQNFNISYPGKRDKASAFLSICDNPVYRGHKNEFTQCMSDAYDNRGGRFWIALRRMGFCLSEHRHNAREIRQCTSTIQSASTIALPASDSSRNPCLNQEIRRRLEDSEVRSCVVGWLRSEYTNPNNPTFPRSLDPPNLGAIFNNLCEPDRMVRVEQLINLENAYCYFTAPHSLSRPTEGVAPIPMTMTLDVLDALEISNPRTPLLTEILRIRRKFRTDPFDGRRCTADNQEARRIILDRIQSAISEAESTEVGSRRE